MKLSRRAFLARVALTLGISAVPVVCRPSYVMGLDVAAKSGDTVVVSFVVVTERSIHHIGAWRWLFQGQIQKTKLAKVRLRTG